MIFKLSSGVAFLEFSGSRSFLRRIPAEIAVTTRPPHLCCRILPHYIPQGSSKKMRDPWDQTLTGAGLKEVFHILASRFRWDDWASRLPGSEGSAWLAQRSVSFQPGWLRILRSPADHRAE